MAKLSLWTTSEDRCQWLLFMGGRDVFHPLRRWRPFQPASLLQCRPGCLSLGRMYFRSTHIVCSLYKRLSKYVQKSKLVNLQIGLWKRLQKSVDILIQVSIILRKPKRNPTRRASVRDRIWATEPRPGGASRPLRCVTCKQTSYTADYNSLSLTNRARSSSCGGTRAYCTSTVRG